jgi:cytidyltransferase-like protein
MNKAGCIVVSGGFDPVHVGHLRMFKAASALVPNLIVIVNNDNFLIEKKGYIFMPIAERMEIIEGFGVVDMVVESIDTDLTVCKTLEWLSKKENVKIFANGGDRDSKDAIPEAEICEQNNITMKFNVGGGKIQSSSSLVSNEIIKPWGSYKTFEKNKGFLVKRITVAPGETLSLQSHKHRSEHWLVASGVATVECDGEKIYLNQFESISIPLGVKHRLLNESQKFLQIVEVQFGKHLSEEDITRFEDKYKRQ